MSREFGINGTPHHDPQAILITRSTSQGQLACFSGHIFDSSRFSSNYVWFAYHFMLNSVATYLRALGSLASSCWGGLWVGSGRAGIPLLANALFACLGQSPPTAWADPPTTGHSLEARNTALKTRAIVNQNPNPAIKPSNQGSRTLATK